MKIISILYDDLPNSCHDIRENLLDFTKFKMQGPFHDLKIIETKSLTTTLKNLTNEYDWAIVVAAGNYIEQQHLLIDTVEHAIKEKAVIAGHILQKGGYFYIHPQWFAINLKEWNNIGCVNFESTYGKEFTTRTVERSEENFHDDYTPYWIKPGNGTTTYKSDYGYFGLDVIKGFIEAGCSITNIPQEIRNKKSYCYPESDHEGIRNIINDPTYKPVEGTGLWWFHRQLKNLTNGLHNGYYVLNTETMPDTDISHFTLDCFIGVCGGFKPALISGANNFSDSSNVFLFDISPAALAWQKFLIENWDGDFSKFENCFTIFKNNHPEYNPHYFTNMSLDDIIDWFLKSGKVTREEFFVRWQKYLKHKHYFYQLDLLEDSTANTILDFVKQAHVGCYVWTSNAFYMDWLMFYKSKKVADAVGDNFIKTIKEGSTVNLFYEGNGYVKSFIRNAK